ncbi:hypothetical protein P9112_000671 [Eukaryota sp. TZLM1-RC]
MAESAPLLQVQRFKSEGAALITTEALPFKWKSPVCSMIQLNPEDRPSAQHILATIKGNLVEVEIPSALSAFLSTQHSDTIISNTVTDSISTNTRASSIPTTSNNSVISRTNIRDKLLTLYKSSMQFLLQLKKIKMRIPIPSIGLPLLLFSILWLLILALE